VTAPWRGDEAETRDVIDVVTHDLRLQGEGKVLTATEWAAAVLYNGLGEFDKALAAARRGAANPQEMGLSTWSMFELAEAAGRLGRPEDAADAVEYLRTVTDASGTLWALGTFHLVSAMVGDASAAEQHYRAGIDKIEQTEVRTLAARAYLSYGEWLRCEGRRAEARAQLSLAHDLLTQIGASGFAERARRELTAAGAATTTRSTMATGAPLTDQELQIARLAAEGLTNPEIGAQMFISAHTVEWHLRKVFTKLGIRSRKDIAVALSE
jgi:ATP/maltotriose-dependent transcriptional regulator MalT